MVAADLNRPDAYFASPTLRRRIKRVMLINPPGKITVTEHGSRERKLAVPPMGLAYLGAQLLRRGYEVDVLDVLIEGYDTEVVLDNAILYGLADEDIRRRIRNFNPDVVGVSCLFSNRGHEALHLCELAKDTLPDAHVVLGGQHPSGCPHLVALPFVDYVMWGEADIALLELLETLNQGGDLTQVSQIVLKAPGGGYWKSPKMNLPDVNDVPHPAWELIRLEDYWNAGLADYEVRGESDKRFMVMISSRGCPHECYFCTAPMMTERRYRRRPIADVVGEIRSYRDRFGVGEVFFWDDNFFVDKKRAKKLLLELVDQFPGMSFQVPSGSEINALDDEVIELMARAGFKKLFMAVESPNEDIQEGHIDKKVKLNRINDLVDKLRSVGIISEGSFMIGFPHETKEQIDNTLSKVQAFGFDRISISIVNPLPGTALYERCEREGLLYENFDPQDVRWSNENIKLPGVERGYLGRRRREVWLEYMQSRIDVEKYETQNVRNFDVFHLDSAEQGG